MDDQSARYLQRFHELECQRKLLEEEEAEFSSILEANGNVGLHGNLIDSEGFPRGDIDLVAVRTARNRIACINTDHALIMKELEEISTHLLGNKQNAVDSNSLLVANSSQPPANPYTIPFLLVDQVADGSLASLAGICVGDRICRFGSLHSTNFNGLATIAAVVRATKDKDVIPVTIVRLNDKATSIHHLVLPKPEGQQTMGFHVVPIK